MAYEEYRTEQPGVGYAETAQPVDPTTISSISDMCMGALESLERQLQIFYSRLEPITQPAHETIGPDCNQPEARSPMGSKLSNIYVAISSMEAQLIDYRNRLNI